MSRLAWFLAPVSDGDQGREQHMTEDRDDFVKRLSTLLLETDTACLAWVLMGNQTHLLLFVDNPKEQNWIENDPGNNKFIACAISLHAEYIVSGDSHLKRLGRIEKLEIVSPREMVKFFESA